MLKNIWRVHKLTDKRLKTNQMTSLKFLIPGSPSTYPAYSSKTKPFPSNTWGKKTTLQFQSWTLTIFACCFCNILSPWSCCVYCVASVCLLWIFTSHSWHANLHMPSNMKSTSLNKRRTSAKERGPKLPMVIFRQVVVFKTVWYQALKCQNRDTVKVQWTNCTTALSFCAHCQWVGETETSQAIQCELVLM